MKMYQLVAENLQKARKRMTSVHFPQPNKLKTEDSVMIKDHTAGPFDPVYKGNYRIIAIKGNQVEVTPVEGGKNQMVHITGVKYILPSDNIIAKLPDYNRFGCKTKLQLNLQNIPDLNWELAITANTKLIPTTTTVTVTIYTSTYIPMSAVLTSTTSTHHILSIKVDKP